MRENALLFGLGIVAFGAAMFAYVGLGTTAGALAFLLVLACLVIGFVVRVNPDSSFGLIGALAILAVAAWLVFPSRESRQFNAEFNQHQRDGLALHAYMRENKVPESVQKEVNAKFYSRQATKDELMQEYFGVTPSE